MVVVFFNSSSSFLEKNEIVNSDYCAFWYSKGLVSYQGLDTVVDNISSIVVEDSIYEDFLLDYKVISERYSITKFTAKNSATIVKDKICFFASNDTIVYSLLSALNRIDSNKWDLFCKEGENAKKAALNAGLRAQDLKFSIDNLSQYDLLVLSNDWGLIEQKINYDFLSKGLNTVCIQESVIDFNIVDQRMLHCSFPIYQGLATLRSIDLKGKICAVIGNPRYEKLTFSSPPEEKRVLINVNFTYGMFEEARAQFVDDIVTSSSEMGLNYFISQHSRDTGDLSSYNLLKTNAGTVHDVLKESSLLVTRFSSLIHESLCLGRPVVYYNPHGEKLYYDFEPDNKCLFYATNIDELKSAMHSLAITSSPEEIQIAIAQYLSKHLGMTVSGNASEYIVKCFDNVSYLPPLKHVSTIKKIKLLLSVIKRNILGQKI